MKIINKKPPIYDKIIKAGMKPTSHTIYAYGDCIYNPNNLSLSKDLIVHEETHSRQQKGDPQTWWKSYLEDKEFRLDQEVEAYRNQYKYLCSQIKDRNKRIKVLHSIAKILSSKIYGEIISKSEAINLIRINVK